MATKKEELNYIQTPEGKSYWNEEGAYQLQYNQIYDSLVPSEGQAQTLIGEVVRAVSRLSYDYYNNGNMNACETTETDGEWIGDEEDGYYEEGELETNIAPAYNKFICLIREFGEEAGKEVSKKLNSVMDSIEDIILNSSYCKFSESEERPYVEMTDIVLSIAVRRYNENQFGEIPSWYEEEDE